MSFRDEASIKKKASITKKVSLRDEAKNKHEKRFWEIQEQFKKKNAFSPSGPLYFNPEVLEVTVEHYGACDFEPVFQAKVASARVKAKDTELEGALSYSATCIFKSIFAVLSYITTCMLGAVQAPFWLFSKGIQALVFVLKYCSGSVLSMWTFCREACFVKLDFRVKAFVQTF